MGYFKGLFTSLAIILPSFLFIHIYDNALTVVGFFQDLIGGNWLSLLDVCETAISEPINVFFVPIDALRIFFAFIPWVVSVFIVSFFFRKKHGARAGLATVMILLFTAAVINMLVIRKELLYGSTFLGPNPLYGFLVSVGVLLIIGFASGAISPFK
ncbi:MAG: hypothetical protein ACFFDW_15720, partial [Candidatus Thorarchaeota archaeon]